jgi:branched-chain amino acid transport system substrate-binding protein
VKFIGSYTKAYGAPPDDVAALTYDAFGLLFTALRNAGWNDREAARDALAKLPGYAGVTGDMKFQEGSGDPVKSAVILQVKGGRFVYVTNASP